MHSLEIVPVHKQSGSRSIVASACRFSKDTFDLYRMTSRSTEWTRSSFCAHNWYGRTFILSIVKVDFRQCQPHPRWDTNPDSRDSKEYPGGMNSFHYAEGLIDGTKKDA